MGKIKDKIKEVLSGDEETEDTKSSKKAIKEAEEKGKKSQDKELDYQAKMENGSFNPFDPEN